MNRNGITFTNDGIHIDFGDIDFYFTKPFDVETHFGVHIKYIGTNYFHATAQRVLRDSLSYSSKADDAQCFSTKLNAFGVFLF